jgi:hypothetical protein
LRSATTRFGQLQVYRYLFEIDEKVSDFGTVILGSSPSSPATALSGLITDRLNLLFNRSVVQPFKLPVRHRFLSRDHHVKNNRPLDCSSGLLFFWSALRIGRAACCLPDNAGPGRLRVGPVQVGMGASAP